MGRDQLTAIILIVVMTVGAGAALAFATQPTRPPVDSYVEEYPPIDYILDPHVLWGLDILEQVYEALYTYPWGSGERGNHPETTPTIPLLAAGAPVITENGTVYTIPLRQGITFHDGTPFNASAAVWNFKRAMKMFRLGGLVEPIAAAIKGGMQVNDAAWAYGPASDEFKAAFDAWEVTDAVEATNTYEVTYRLEQPAAYFIPAMTNGLGRMMSPTFAEKHATSPGASFGVDYGEKLTYMYNHTCGTGPYQVVEPKEDEYVHMTLNEDYWRADATEAAIAPPSYAGSIKEISTKINGDLIDKKENLRNGFVDVFYWPPSWHTDDIYDSVTMGSKDPTIFFRTGGVWPRVLGISFEMGLANWTGSPDYEAYSPFHWRALRNMVAYLLDYHAIIQKRYGDWAFRAEGPMQVGMPYQNSSYWTEHYDLEIAVEYWNEAMQDPDYIDSMNTIGCKIPLALSYSNDTIADLVSLQLKKGFDAMKQLPQMNMTELNHEPEISLYPPFHPWFPSSFPIDRELIHLWGSSARYADPDAFVFPSLHSSGEARWYSYNNSVMDDLIMQGRAETDPVARQEIYNQIQELAAYESPYLWLCWQREFTTFRTWLKGTGMRFQPWAWYYIYHVYKDYTTTDTTTTTGGQTTTGTTGDHEPQPLGLYPLVLGGSGVVIAVAVVYIIYRKRSDIAAATEAVLWGT
ncbi:MAG: ABC transporter substrate-binding protein [Candidatus Thorarchaeota archaeon]